MITDQNYLAWQKKLENHSLFRWFLVFFGLYSIILVYVAGIFLVVDRKFQELFLVAAAFVLARLVISPLIFLFYKKQRPYQKLNFIPPNSLWLFSGTTSRNNSFPSDHAASFAAITLSLFWFYPLFGFILFPIAILNGVARVMLGYHHISDILAGWLMGAFAGWVVITWLTTMLFTH